MVIYGSIMGVSIACLFAAGILPGLLIALICMAVIAIFGKRWNLPKGSERPTFKHLWAALRVSILALIMPVLVLGCIPGDRWLERRTPLLIG